MTLNYKGGEDRTSQKKYQNYLNVQTGIYNMFYVDIFIVHSM